MTGALCRFGAGDHILEYPELLLGAVVREVFLVLEQLNRGFGHKRRAVETVVTRHLLETLETRDIGVIGGGPGS